MKKYLNPFVQTLMMLVLIASTQITNAQNFKLEHKSGTLEIGEMIGSLYLEAYNGSEIMIEGSESYRRPNRADGLKVISSVNDNTNLGLNYTKNGDVVMIRAVRRRNTGGYRIKVPKDVKLTVRITTSWFNRLSIKNFSSDINIKTRFGKIELDNVTGGVWINARHGMVKANFPSMNENIDIDARHGGIDITLPAQTKADLRASSRYGEIYTNMEIKQEKSYDSGMTSLSRKAEVVAKLNGGGKQLRLSARHANIYLRKQ